MQQPWFSWLASSPGAGVLVASQCDSRSQRRSRSGGIVAVAGGAAARAGHEVLDPQLVGSLVEAGVAVGDGGRGAKNPDVLAGMLRDCPQRKPLQFSGAHKMKITMTMVMKPLGAKQS